MPIHTPVPDATPRGQLDFAAIDFETANYRQSSACSLAVVEVKNGEIAGRHSWLIRPEPLYFIPRFTDLHGISAEKVRRQPLFSAIWPEIAPLITGTMVAAHNAAFDMGVLRSLIDEYQLCCPPLSSFCSLMVSRRLWRHLPRHDLGSMARTLKIELQHHDALSDAEACARILIHACRETGTSDLAALSERLGLKSKSFPGSQPPVALDISGGK